MKDDNDRFREGTLPLDAFENAALVPLAGSTREAETSTFRPFPVDVLPEPIRSFVNEAAEAIGCDTTFVALPVLAGCASAIGNTRRIRLKRGWTEPSVIWAVIVGESGTQKSPALDVALAPLKRRQAKALAAYREEKSLFDEQVQQRREQTKSTRSGMPSVNERRLEAPVPYRILCADVTAEALAARLQDAPRGLLVSRDELSGWISGFDQYKAGRGGDVAHWLEMHRAGDLLIDRKTNNEIISVPRAALSVTGGIQPGILKRILGDEHVENGLAARLLLAKPPRRPKQWSDQEVDPTSNSKLAKLYDALLELDFEESDPGERNPIDLSLTPEGLDLWKSFVNQHGLEQLQHGGDLAAAWSKLEGYAARLALVIHVIRDVSRDHSLGRSREIDAVSVGAGIELVRWFAQETARIYAEIGLSVRSSQASSLIDRISDAGGRISVRQLMQSSRQYRSDRELAQAELQGLVDSGRGRWVTQKLGGPGRPSQYFELSDTRNSLESGNTIPAVAAISDVCSVPAQDGNGNTIHARGETSDALSLYREIA